jgi:hypothetical protein
MSTLAPCRVPVVPASVAASEVAVVLVAIVNFWAVDVGALLALGALLDCVGLLEGLCCEGDTDGILLGVALGKNAPG